MADNNKKNAKSEDTEVKFTENMDFNTFHKIRQEQRNKNPQQYKEDMPTSSSSYFMYFIAGVFMIFAGAQQISSMMMNGFGNYGIGSIIYRFIILIVGFIFMFIGFRTKRKYNQEQMENLYGTKKVTKQPKEVQQAPSSLAARAAMLKNDEKNIKK